jgi:glycosyltransferase involved in cell wall biosynthesis
MTHPKITLITPSFNQGKFLEQTISSVLDQKYPDLEYIIMDGGSADQSIEIIKKYASGISFWASEKDNGQAHAINKGLRMATGDVVSWINSDDYLEKNSLFTIAENFKKKEVNCVIGKIAYFNSGGELWRSENVVKKPDEKTLGSGVVPQPAMYFSKACYDKIGLLNESLHFCFDSEWYMRYLIHYGTGQILEIPDLLVHFRFHQDSKTMNNSIQFQEERCSICYSIAQQTGNIDLINLLPSLNKIDTSYHFEIPEKKTGLSIEKAMNYLVLLLGNEYYAQNEKQKAARCFEVVKESLLEKEDLILFKKLKFRNSYVPLPLIKFLRKTFE